MPSPALPIGHILLKQGPWTRSRSSHFGSRHISLSILLTWAVMLGCGATCRADLVISGILGGDGSTFPQAIELYALRDITDLSSYAIGIADDGLGSDGPELTLSGSIVRGDYLIVTNSSSLLNGFLSGITSEASAVVNANGNDAVELFQLGVRIDLFGEPTHGGTIAWDYTNGWAYRKSERGPSNSFSVDDWIISKESLAANNGGENPFPAASYTNDSASLPEPSALLLISGATLAVLGYRAMQKGRANRMPRTN